LHTKVTDDIRMQILHQSRHCLPAYIITSINNASCSGCQGWADENYEVLWQALPPCIPAATHDRIFQALFLYICIL